MLYALSKEQMLYLQDPLMFAWWYFDFRMLWTLYCNRYVGSIDSRALLRRNDGHDVDRKVPGLFAKQYIFLLVKHWRSLGA